MAINKKLIHFKNKEAFDRELQAGNILDTSICFIPDAKFIYTRGSYWYCPYSKEELNLIIEDKILESLIPYELRILKLESQITELISTLTLK